MHTVISVFDDQAAAQRALESLASQGFPREDLHVERNTADMGESRALNSDGTEAHDRGSVSNFGHFFASLFGQDQPKHTSVYSEAVRRGSAVLVVDARDDVEAERAASLLHGLGAIDVDERAQEWRASGWKADDDGDLAAGKQGVMDVVQEELQVGKRSLDKGGVRVVQRVSEKPVRELLKLREERVDVERRAVDRPATQDDLTNFKEGTLEVREMAEEPVVAKSARVVEEVRVGKQVQEREQVIEDTLRRKDVDVERIPGQGSLRETDLERERAVASDSTLRKDKPTR